MTVYSIIFKKIQGFMRLNGFNCRKGCFYKIDRDIAFCVELENPSGLVYVNCYVIPLYIPTEYRYFTYGTRVNMILPIVKIESNDVDLWCNQLIQLLSNSIFPSFEKITSPGAFFEQVSTGQLLKPHNCHISKVHVQRLQLFTALYEQHYTDISSICDKNTSVLMEMTSITPGVKKMYLEEIQCVRNLLTISGEEQKKHIAHIINKTKLKCFGVQTK